MESHTQEYIVKAIEQCGPEVMRQAKFEGCCAVVFASLFVLAAVIVVAAMVVYAIRKGKHADRTNYVWGALFVSGFLVLGFACSSMAYTALVNPKFWALQTIMQR